MRKKTIINKTTGEKTLVDFERDIDENPPTETDINAIIDARLEHYNLITK